MLVVHSIMGSFQRNMNRVGTWCNMLMMRIFDSYRPELHYMRGPGPKCCAKHEAALRAILLTEERSHRVASKSSPQQ